MKLVAIWHGIINFCANFFLVLLLAGSVSLSHSLSLSLSLFVLSLSNLSSVSPLILSFVLVVSKSDVALSDVSK
jgi:hypothetical protein